MRTNKKQFSFVGILSLVSIIFLFPSCKTIPDKTSPLSGEPTASFPDMRFGDSWTFKRIAYLGQDEYNSFEKVISVEKDMSFVIEVARSDSDKVYHKYYNNKYQLFKILDFSSGQMKRTSSPSKPLNFPLFVGKTWKDAYSGQSVGGTSQNYTNSYKVIKYEMINTKAGSFKAFKIRRINSISGGYGGPWTSYSWYAPEVKRIIKFQPPPDGTYYYLKHELTEVDLAKAAKITGKENKNRRTTAQKLEKLKDLLEKGLITQEDYDNKKNELLDSL